MPELPEQRQLIGEFNIEFLHRVYRTTAILAVLGGLLIAERFGLSAAIGWGLGVSLHLGSMVSVEWSVRRLLVPGQRSLRMLSLISAAKLVLVITLLAAAALAALRGLLSPFWLLAGFVLPHAVMLLKLLGQRVLLLTGAAGAPVRPPAAGRRGSDRPKVEE